MMVAIIGSGGTVTAEVFTGVGIEVFIASVCGAVLIVAACLFYLLLNVMDARRVGLLRDIYTMGYRHGRHDATTSLLEQGIWLSEAAEKKARGEMGNGDFN